MLACLLLACLFAAVLYVRHFAPPANAGRIQNSTFTTGVNYPWVNYGNDFGTSPWGAMGISDPETSKVVDSDFAYLQSHGISVVRWFLFCDARSGILFDKSGYVVGLDDHLLPDMTAAVEIARRHHIRIIFVLFDFAAFGKASHIRGVQLGGRSDLVTNTAKRQSLIEQALKPMFAKFSKDATIIAWEVVNEPEWLMSDMEAGLDPKWQNRLGSVVKRRVKTSSMQAFVSAIVDVIHEQTNQDATVGSASRSSLDYWRQCKLDFYQIHYYPYMEFRSPYNHPAVALQLDKPVIVGEFPTKHSVRDVSTYLDLAVRNGYAGALGWSLRATDRYSDFRSVAPQFDQFIQAHRRQRKYVDWLK